VGTIVIDAGKVVYGVSVEQSRAEQSRAKQIRAKRQKTRCVGLS